jgi:hypothetical protein
LPECEGSSELIDVPMVGGVATTQVVRLSPDARLRRLLR